MYLGCSDNNGGCDQRVECLEQNNTISCGPCPEGTQGDGFYCTGNSLLHLRHFGIVIYSYLVLCGDGTCDPLVSETCETCPMDCIGECGMYINYINYYSSWHNFKIW